MSNDADPPQPLSTAMLGALRALRDGTRYHVLPMTRRALVGRGLAIRVAVPAPVKGGATHKLVITEAGLAAIAEST